MSKSSWTAGRPRKSAFVPLLNVLEDRTLLATLVVNPAGGPGVYTTISAAVSAAMAGDTIAINPAMYTEQVTINTSLTMMGTAAGVVIQSPMTLTPDLGEVPVVEIKGGATVNISNLTIQGPAPLQDIAPGTQAAINGIYVVGGATANLTGVTITDIGPEPITGFQFGGRGILVGHAVSSAQGVEQEQVGHATITDCTITHYQKNGIQGEGTGTTVTATGNMVYSGGPTPVNGENGIVIGAGTTGTVTNNIVSGNQFTGTGSGPDPINDVQGAGIVIEGSASVAGNTVTSNDEDIVVYTSTTGTTISGNITQDSFVGVGVEQGMATISNNIIDGNNIGVAVIAFNGNTADSQGTFLSNNIFNNGNGGASYPGAGISVLEETGAETRPLLTANFNRIVGNSVGLNNGTTTASDAPLNWWGINTGPNTPGGDKASGDVNLSPWLLLTIAASPSTITAGETATVTASVITDSNGATYPSAPFFPNSIPIIFGATDGTITPTSTVSQSGSASSNFTSNTPGTATISATLDNQTVSLSFMVTPAVTAPIVVSLQRFGFHAQPTTFVLTFSAALDPASAQDLANYHLNSISGHKLGRAIRIKAATYNPADNTVTLHPGVRVHLFAQYRLVVNGSTPTGVKGATGLLLDGNGNGQPGSDYVATFGKEILAGPNVQTSRANRSSLHRSRSEPPILGATL
jgi:hypothetical protein